MTLGRSATTIGRLRRQAALPVASPVAVCGPITGRVRRTAAVGLNAAPVRAVIGLAALGLSVTGVLGVRSASAREVTTSSEFGIRLTAVAKAQLPIALVAGPRDEVLYIVEKPGRIRALRDGLLDPVPVLDISERVSFAIERGLLSVAFSPKDPTKLWVVYTDRAGTWRLSEFPFIGGRADAAAERNLISIKKSTSIHHGGSLAFDADGRLYISVGDGGPGGDPTNKAQRLDVLEAEVRMAMA